jgi:hypothetical protein
VNSTRLKRLGEAFQSDDWMDRRPTTPDGWHRLLLAEGSMQSLVNLNREAFGPDDPRVDASYLRTLSYHQLLDVYRDAMNTMVKRHLADGSMDWFKALPYAEKIRLCRHLARDRDEIDRLKRAVNRPKPAPSCSEAEGRTLRGACRHER